LHRDGDQPAVIASDHNGPYQAWYQHGTKHRDDGKPAVVHANGTKEYWVDGQWQRYSK